MNNDLKRVLWITCIAIVMSVTFYMYHQRQRREETIESILRLRQTIATGYQLQTIALQYRDFTMHFPSYTEFTNIAHFTDRYPGEILSTPTSDVIAAQPDTRGGWRYDEQTGMVTLNVGSVFRLSDRCELNPASVRFFPKIYVPLFGHDAESILDHVLPSDNGMTYIRSNVADSLRAYFEKLKGK